MELALIQWMDRTLTTEIIYVFYAFEEKKFKKNPRGVLRF